MCDARQSAVCSAGCGVEPRAARAQHVPGARADHIDEWTIGFEQIVGSAARLTIRAIRRELRSAFAWGIDTDRHRIVIGHQGERIRAIGRSARLKIEALVSGAVYLDLWVKVLPNWRRDREALRRLGLRPDEVLHVGDHPRNDLAGARRAGLHALLLVRDGCASGSRPVEGSGVVHSLLEVPARLLT